MVSINMSVQVPDSKAAQAALDPVIDAFGATLAGSGAVSATAGRIFALLMVSETPLSQADIRVRLQVSEGSVSEGTRALETIGMIQRVTYPQVRRDFFRIHDDAWVNCAELTLAFVMEMNELASSLQDKLRSAAPVVQDQVRLMSDYYELLARELPKVLRRSPRK
jgi:predicted transcriptional regulator